MNAPTPSAAERGDTVPRWLRNLIRLGAVAVFLLATLGVAVARSDRIDVSSVLRGDFSAPSASPTPSSSPTSTTGPGGSTAPVQPVATEDPLAHAAQEVRLLDEEDARLRAASMAQVSGMQVVDGTLVLGDRPAPYTLADLVRSGAATRVSESVVLVTEPVTVRRDARLVVDAPGTTLRLASGPKGFASLVAWGGDITLTGTAKAPLVVEGWDGAAGDDETADGRAYVRVKDGALEVAHADLRHLGFWSGRTGGLALTGSNETVATATLDDVDIDQTHLGLYVSGADRVRATGLRVTKAEQYGVEVTNQSHDVRLDGLRVNGAGNDALSVSNGSSHVELVRGVLQKAAGYGVDVNGTPLADGPNSAGYGIGNYAWVRIADTTAEDNTSGGIRVQSIDHLEISGCTLTADRSTLQVAGTAKDVTVSDCTLDSTDGTGLVVSDGVEDAGISALTVTAFSIGIDIADSTAAVDDSTITVGTGHGISVSGSDASATLRGNTINGRGSSAVDASGGATVTGGDHVAGSWTYRPEIVLWAEAHAAAMPLLAVLVVPAAGLVFVFRRRRQQKELRRIFEATLVARGRAAIDEYTVERPAAAAPLPPTPMADAEVGAEPVETEPVGAEPVEVGAEAAAAVPAAPTESGAEPETVPAAEEAAPAPEPTPEPARAAARTEPVDLASREFTSPREFALAAVLEAGYPATMVARVLHVPTSRVRTWIKEAEQADAAGGPEA